MTRWIRARPERGDTVAAAAVSVAVAAGVGLATFYVTRLLLAREPLSARDEVAVGRVEAGRALRP